jgi:hypothetical protein
MSFRILGTALLLVVVPLAASAANVVGQREAWSNWAGGLDDRNTRSQFLEQEQEQEMQRTSSDPNVRKRYMCNGAATIVIQMAEARDSGAGIDHLRDAAIETWHAPKKLADTLAKMTYTYRAVAPMDLGTNMAVACESNPNSLKVFGFLLE